MLSMGRDDVEVSVRVLMCQESGFDRKMCLLRVEGFKQCASYVFML